jgi:hypothetical protein
MESGVRNLVRAGVPEKVVMAISGHATLSVFECYDITDRESFAEAGRRLAEFNDEKFTHNIVIQRANMEQGDSPLQ